MPTYDDGKAEWLIAEAASTRDASWFTDNGYEMAEQLEAARAEIGRLNLLINTPRTDEFFEAVRVESAHQINRWGVEHDAGKRSEDWVTLFIYLLGKAARAHFDGDRTKLEHHVITSAAVALNWWRHLTGVHTAMRPGVAAATPPSSSSAVGTPPPPAPR